MACGRLGAHRHHENQSIFDRPARLSHQTAISQSTVKCLFGDLKCERDGKLGFNEHITYLAPPFGAPPGDKVPMAARSRFGLTILIAGNASYCGARTRTTDNARPPNQGKRAVFVGCWAPQEVKETLVRLKMPRSSRLDPIAAGQLSSAHSEVWLRQHEVAASPSQEALGTVQANQLHPSFGFYNLVNIQLAIVHEWSGQRSFRRHDDERSVMRSQAREISTPVWPHNDLTSATRSWDVEALLHAEPTR